MESGDDGDADFDRGFEKASYGFSKDDLANLGERTVRDRLAHGDYGHEGTKPRAFVEAWLKDREFAHTQEAKALASASVLAATVAASEAVRANDTARKHNTVAVVAMIVTAVIAIIGWFVVKK